MKLKTKAKILSGILSLSYIAGSTLSNTAYAASNPTGLRIIRPTTIANETGRNDAEDLRDALNDAFDTIEATDDFVGVALGLEADVREKNITLTIKSRGTMPNAAELADALEVAYEYFSMTQNPIFINDLIAYIRTRPLDLSTDRGILLHKAVSLGCCDFVRFLLNDCGLDINIQDNAGATPLHTAVCHGNVRMVRLLLEHPKIRTDIKDNAGKSAYCYAAAKPQTIVSFVGEQIESLEGQMVRTFNIHGITQ